MSFNSRYQLERLLADGAAKTFRAVENSSGRTVLLHVFNPEGRSLFDQIAAGCRDAEGGLKAPLIETGDFQGSPYAVTELIDPFTDLRTWAEGAVPSLAPAPPAPASPGPRTPAAGPGEFTRMFAVPTPGTPPVEVPPKREMGAFTAEFFAKSETPPTPPVTPQPSAWPAKPSAEPPKLPDDLELPANKPAAKPQQPKWPESSRPAIANEISDLFGPSLKGEHIDVEAEQARAAQAARVENKPFQRAGTFTKMFGPGGPRDKTGRLDRSQTQEHMLLKTGSGPVAYKETPQKDTPPKDAQKGEGPGEYTRMMKAAPMEQTPDPALPPPATPLAPVAATSNNRMNIGAFVLIGILLIVVIILAALLYAYRK